MIQRRYLLAAGLTAAVLASRLTGTPALTDPTGASVPDRFHLVAPPLYWLAAPLFTLWDGVSMLSLSRLKGLVGGLMVMYLLSRLVAAGLRRSRGTAERGKRTSRGEVATAAGAMLGFAIFVVLGAVWHRPMVALAGTTLEEMLVDVHSHTNASHDVRGTLMEDFDLEANRRWHRRAGFDLVFVTDHNAITRSPGAAVMPVPCPGVEVSAWRAHVLLLGDTMPVERSRYGDSLAGVGALFRDAATIYSALSIASIPEYERHHWGHLDEFVTQGVSGFEVVNASPKANELARARRDTVIALARANDRLIVGASDIHGWGATSMVWNVIRVPGWRIPGANPCAMVLHRLGTGGFPAVRILERHRLRPDDRWPGWLTPVGVVWETWASLDWLQALSWIGWAWLLAVILPLTRRRLSCDRLPGRPE